MIPSHIDANEIIRDSISPSELYYIKEGVREQLRQGMINPNIATKAQRQYRPYTKKIRRRKGKPIDFVNLNFTGSLYRSVVVQLSGMTLKVGNFAPSYERLLADPMTGSWAKDSMGVSRETMERFIRKVNTIVVHKII